MSCGPCPIRLTLHARQTRAGCRRVVSFVVRWVVACWLLLCRLRAACSFRGSLFGLARCPASLSSCLLLSCSFAFVAARWASLAPVLPAYISRCSNGYYPRLPFLADWLGGANPGTPLPRGMGFPGDVRGRRCRLVWRTGGLGRLGLAPAPRFVALGSSRHGGVGGFAPGWVGTQLGAALAGLLAGRLFGWLGPGVGGTKR